MTHTKFSPKPSDLGYGALLTTLAAAVLSVTAGGCLQITVEVMNPSALQGALPAIQALPVGTPVPGPDALVGLKRWYRSEALEEAQVPEGTAVPSGLADGLWADGSGNYGARSLSADGLFAGPVVGSFAGVTLSDQERLRASYSAATYPGQGTSFTYVFIASRGAILPGAAPLIQAAPDLSGHSQGNFMGWLSDSRFRFSNSGSGGGEGLEVDVAPFSAPELEVWMGVQDLEGSTDRPGMALYRDGALEAASTNLSAPGPSASGFAELGGAQADGTQVHLVEVILYNRALTQGDRCGIWMYINDRYGLGLSGEGCAGN